MILIGQYDSPFVRRVGIALTLYGLPFEHRPWSAYGDIDKLRQLNPLLRVPTMVLEDGAVLTDSHAMLDYLDSRVPAERALFPREEPERHRALGVATLATGMADKAVTLFNEKRLHKDTAASWIERCRSQIASALSALDKDRAARKADWWFGERIGHADIAVACALRFLGEAHPGMIAMGDYPALAAHATRSEALPVFKSVSQTFIPPK